MDTRTANFLLEHASASRRYFLQFGAAGMAALSSVPLLASSDERDPVLEKAIKELETWLTMVDDFQDVSRGKPKPHSLPEEKKKEVGLTRDTWKLEVVSDPENPARVRNPFTKALIYSKPIHVR